MKSSKIKGIMFAAILLLFVTGCVCERGASWNPIDGYASAGQCYVPCVPGLGTCGNDGKGDHNDDGHPDNGNDDKK